jgi:hypothetical protein
MYIVDYSLLIAPGSLFYRYRITALLYDPRPWTSGEG